MYFFSLLLSQFSNVKKQNLFSSQFKVAPLQKILGYLIEENLQMGS